ncbi:histidine kinase [Paenibacillus sambharensis]|uniref:Histidine kinase n=1 Tax=Paenibacillus sambharensis TaxID=1803190 RepID=A0A2W1LU09_9BACL|nr:helix-turn-helix transcriptional regulator [Paenibacillus sambharensis]PZD94957.1 histidine kinase [Paenibacillus sambharensis]
MGIELTARQLELISLVKQHAPVTGDQLAEMLGVSRPTLRSDLSLLVMLGMLDAKPKVGYFLGTAYRAESGRLNGFNHLKVREVQAVPVSVAETQSVHDAVVTLFTENVNTLLVVDSQQRFVGIITPKDLLKVTLGNPNAEAIPVSMVMTRYPNIVTAAPDELVRDAVRKMVTHELDCLPVIDSSSGSGREATGWITKTHVISLFGDIVSAAQLGGQADG